MSDIQKSRAGQAVSDETIAKFRAAKGFLVLEWIGALMLVGSFTQLYVFGLLPNARVLLVEIIGVVMAVLGTVLWASARNAYYAIDFPWKRRWEFFATVVAGAGFVFWLLFLVAAFLAWRGVDFL